MRVLDYYQNKTYFCCLAQFKERISISKEFEMCVTPRPNNNTKKKHCAIQHIKDSHTFK